MVLPMTRRSGSSPQAARAAARTSADRVGLVDHEQRAGGARQLPQRVVVAGIGQHDADVGERRLGEDAGHVAHGQRRLERGHVVEGHDDGGQRGIDLRADGAVPGHDLPAVVERGQGLVDRAVVAPVEDEDLGPAGDVAGEPQHEAVGVGGRHRQLPERQPEAPVELGSHPHRVGSGEHRRDAPTGLVRDGLGHLRQRVTGHGARVPEAEVDVRMAVDVSAAGALGALHEDREGAGPAGHPRHRDAAEQVVSRLSGQGRGRGVAVDEALVLGGPQLRQPVAVDAHHRPILAGRSRPAPPPRPST